MKAPYIRGNSFAVAIHIQCRSHKGEAMRFLTMLLALITVLCLTASLRAADDPPRTVSTTGEATVYVVPNKVIINLGVETANSSLDEAKSANQKAGTSLLSALKSLGLEDRDISTDNLNVQIRYNNHDGMQSDILGYIVRRGYAVTLKDPKLFEKLVDIALKNGANQISDISFQSTDLRKYRDQARSMAIRAAKEKAAALAGELDCKIGKPRSISESGGYYFGGYRSYGGNAWAQNSVAMAPAGSSESGESLPLGQIAVSASVSVSFDLD
jgi:uncharacterized protein YggE